MITNERNPMRVSAITLSVDMYCTYKMIVHIQHSIYTNSDLTD